MQNGQFGESQLAFSLWEGGKIPKSSVNEVGVWREYNWQGNDLDYLLYKKRKRQHGINLCRNLEGKLTGILIRGCLNTKVTCSAINSSGGQAVEVTGLN